ncbi:kinetochore Sim4 complex subunit Fta4 [Calycina marina]|uniref:Kinetochore Sim4 complex subunit Fta4 n=1 Tax=Calycina marina TaxID=1763456 RepID=A0A9P7Z1X2_9HELO|nr:kinetochore Sim4 complex subunit Fta4 [Calycina marina]
MSPPTIIDAKISFLRTQILQLSQALRISPQTLNTITTAEDNALRQKAIDEALRKANVLLKRHLKVCYGPQATRHVAEQIDRLYWVAGDASEAGEVEEWCERGVDLRQDGIITQLPPEWSEEAFITAPSNAAKYEELQQRLAAANKKRRAAKEKLEQYRRMKDMVSLFEGGDVQQNLVVKNGEVEKELERMRMLMLRVERGLSGLGEREGREEMEGIFGDDDEEEEKIRRLFAW